MAKKVEHIKLGLELENYRYDSRHCTGQCQCRWIDFNYTQNQEFAWRCPSWQSEKYDAYGAVGKCNLVYNLLMGRLDYKDTTLQDVVFKCTLCGSCDVACKRNLDYEIQLMLESLRARLVEKGNSPAAHKERTDNIVKEHNRFGKDQAKRFDWLSKSLKVADKANYLLHAGCRASFQETGIARSAVQLFNLAGVPVMVNRNEECCGHFLFTTGQVAKAKKVAQDNIKALKATGAKTLVTACAHCYKSFKVDYPKLLDIPTSELGFEVKHITEVADEWVKSGQLKLTKPVNMKITYHDPCNLGRLSEPWQPWEGERGYMGQFVPSRNLRRGRHGNYEQPRDLLKAVPGVELVEMVRRRECAYCCGNDGGAKEAYPEFAAFAAGERVKEAAATGAEAIVTACPGCVESFTESAPNSLKVYDITEVLVKAAGK